jgi:hypothetical protein
VLTAYGLLEFADMGKVYPVDPDLLVRTRKWLLDQQKPDGSWAPDAQWLHDWSAAQEGAQATTAWIAWALAEAGTQDESLDRALVWLEQRVPDLTPFQLGLLAGAQTRLKRAPTAVSALAKHTQNGRVQAGQSLFSRSPVSADVQATALANQAWVRTGDTRAADAALDWIWQQRQSAGWGNTQATVLALRAALAHRSAPPPKGATIALSLDGEAPSALTLDGTDVPARTWTIQPGTHALALRGPAAALRADLDVRWRSPRPPGTPVVLGLSVQVDRPEKSMAVGQSEVFTVRLHNPGKHTVPMPTVEVPVPPGFRVDMAHFPPTGVARAEDQGDRVVFYLKRLAPDARASIDFQLQALAEVDVLHRPAQVYAYYDPEIRGQSAAARLQARVPQPVARLPARPRLNAVQLGVGSAGRPQ